MTATLQPRPLDIWRRRFGGRRYRRTQPRPLAAAGYLTHGQVIDGLIEVENLQIVLLYDEQLRAGHCALRLAAYCGSRVPWGVRFGGLDNCRAFKDLRLQPVPGGHGYRLDLAQEADLLTLSLSLERQLDRHARFCQHLAWQQLCLPKLWAAFRPADAARVTGDGPELAAYATRTGKSPQHLLRRLCREHLGMVLYPLDWTSHLWETAAAVYADLERFPRRQVFRLHTLPDDLVGFQGAAEYRLYGRDQRPSSMAAAAVPAAC
jgi:hypothetical protein